MYSNYRLTTRIHTLLFLCLTGIFALPQRLIAQAPEPFGAIPSERQMKWQEMEFYMFVHFNINTFTDMEWGTGGESPEIFNPTDLDCFQWAKIAKDAGMKGIIITAKHHDGFCLWPSKYTEHSVKNSPWKSGKGDVIAELRAACDHYGLKLGIYYSPWDRNHADYGKPEYLTYFHQQLTELLTEYGEIFEVWFDGANGGDGYYGGANEMRKVDRKTYYDFPSIWNRVRALQPHAVMFSDAGPDVRWIGNERGIAGRTMWSTLNRDKVWPGWPHADQLNIGHQRGSHWVPGEADVSIRPGWYYHESEDHKIHSLSHLLDIYYQSVGRNASLLLNFPVDRRGKIHAADSARVMALAHQIKEDFKSNILTNAKVSSTNVRLNQELYQPSHVLDDDFHTYWTTDDFINTGTLVFEWTEPQYINRLLLQEYIPLGQRIDSFTVAVDKEGAWHQIAQETTIGYKRILRFKDVKTNKIKVTIVNSMAPPILSKVAAYRAPKVLSDISITRNEQDIVHISSRDSNVVLFYTLDGSTPSSKSTQYHQPFPFNQKGKIKAMAYDPITQISGEIFEQNFDIPKQSWQFITPASDDVEKAIDGNPYTTLSLPSDQKFIIDLGKMHSLSGFTYLPDQKRYSQGIIAHYELKVSKDGKKWKTVHKGRFDNIQNNPILQIETFKKTKARYIHFIPLENIQNDSFSVIAEFDLLTH